MDRELAYKFGDSVKEGPMKKILIADDHDLVRETIADYLRQQTDIEIETACSLDDALSIENRNGPYELVLLDYSMPEMDGLNGLTRMIAQTTGPVAILSGTAPSGVAQRALRMGAAGFVPKTLAPNALVAAVEHMIAGEIYVPEDVELQRGRGLSEVKLTPRETDVLRRLTDGMSNKEIARDLDIQEVTVKLHVKTLSRKLDARNRTHAAMLARDLDLC